MESGVANNLIAVRQASIQYIASLKVLKLRQDMQVQLLSAIDAAAKSLPPPPKPGQGVFIDKTA